MQPYGQAKKVWIRDLQVTGNASRPVGVTFVAVVEQLVSLVRTVALRR